jgi:hypothetical protein
VGDLLVDEISKALIGGPGWTVKDIGELLAFPGDRADTQLRHPSLEHALRTLHGEKYASVGFFSRQQEGHSRGVALTCALLGGGGSGP